MSVSKVIGWILLFNLCVVKKYIVFYATSKCYDSVIVDAESLSDAFEIAQAFSRVYAATILGVFDQVYYFKIHPYE